MSADRYDRQRRLAEVGASGQERIAGSSAVIAAGPSAASALAYLARAGVPRARVERVPGAGFAHAAAFRFAAPRALAAGAHAALQHLREVLRER